MSRRTQQLASTAPSQAVRALKARSFVTGFAWAGGISVVVGLLVRYTAKRRVESALLAAGVDPAVVSNVL